MKTKTIVLLAGLILSFSCTYSQAKQAVSKSRYTSKQSIQSAPAKANQPPRSNVSTTSATGKAFVADKRKQRRMERKKLRMEAKLNKKVDKLVLRMTGGYGYFSAP